LKTKAGRSGFFFYYFPFGFGEGGLFPLPPPDGLPVVLGALTGFGFFAIFIRLRVKLEN
jgi:hypothetical protein